MGKVQGGRTGNSTAINIIVSLCSIFGYSFLVQTMALCLHIEFLLELVHQSKNDSCSQVLDRGLG